MVIVFILVGILVVGGVALAAIGRLGGLPPAPVDRRPDGLPADGPLTAVDLAGVQFDVGLRGYRQDEVDALLERVTRTLAEREQQIAALSASGGPAGLAGGAPGAADVPSPADAPSSGDAPAAATAAHADGGQGEEDHPFGGVDDPAGSRTPPVTGAPAQRGHISG